MVHHDVEGLYSLSITVDCVEAILSLIIENLSFVRTGFPPSSSALNLFHRQIRERGKSESSGTSWERSL